eukprot:jgi/Chrzof1/6227/Cz17g16140.t1
MPSVCHMCLCSLSCITQIAVIIQQSSQQQSSQQQSSQQQSSQQQSSQQQSSQQQSSQQQSSQQQSSQQQSSQQQSSQQQSLGCNYHNSNHQTAIIKHVYLLCVQALAEDTEFQAGLTDQRGRRKLGTGSASNADAAVDVDQQEQAAAAGVQDTALLYVRCLQTLLQAQGEALVNQFGVIAQVIPVMRQLWLSYIPTCGILEPDFYNRPGQPAAPTDTDAATAEEENMGTEPDDEDHDDGTDDAEQQQQQQQQQMMGRGARHASELRKITKLRSALWGACHPQTTLHIAYLACLYTREAVTTLDIIRWSLDGQLPYLNLPAISAGQLSSAGPSVHLPLQVLRPVITGGPMQFMARCYKLAGQLKLALPPINGGALLQRAVLQLGLPQVGNEWSNVVCVK